MRRGIPAGFRSFLTWWLAVGPRRGVDWHKLRIQIKNTRLVRALSHPATKIVLAVLIVGAAAGGGVFAYYYTKFARLIDRRLAVGVFAHTSKIYAAPEAVFAGQAETVADLEGRLRRSGYSETKTNRVGWYQEVKGGLEIFPGPDSYFQDEPVLIRLADGVIDKIVSLRDNTEQQRYELEPELITNMFDRSREKRRPIRYEDIPDNLRDAILSAEDKNFFQHSGFDYLRLVKATFEGIQPGNRIRATSTLTQQLARGFFLTSTRTLRRKAAEALIAMQLEHRLSKEQIFEFYCNHIYLGQRGSFSIAGVGEAALAYFGKDVKQLALPEAAFIAGMVRGPNIYNPYKYPDRARERRNLVLEAMARNGFITERQREEAAALPLKVVPGSVETGDAPYFVDLVRETLLARYSEKDLISDSYRIYTTLDINLQRAAGEAVREGMKLVDDQLAKRKKKYPPAQVALVVLDAHNGEVKALVGGRAYGVSQLNHAVAMRQPGSAFKPFVYAAAFESALDGTGPVVTPITVVDDSPTTFVYEGMPAPYEPSNYKEKFLGPVTARYALAHSLNVATVKIGEMAGFDKIAQLAQDAGLKNTKATPAEALGAYEAAPLDVAGAYTVFANAGVHVEPSMVRTVKNQNGDVIEEHKPVTKVVLDARIAGLMTNMMEGVIQSGTGAGVRALGFTAPAAGKTGTSHDGWFAGYTSNLICVVWVGFDDNQELPLSGAQSALPVWTAFMKRASTLRQYRNMAGFDAPPGLVSVDIDSASGLLATPGCPDHRSELFIEGSQPTEYCSLHGLQTAQPRIAAAPSPAGVVAVPQPAPVPAAPPRASASPTSDPAIRTNGPVAPEPGAKQTPPQPEKKKGFFGRILGAITGSDSQKPPPADKRKPPQEE